MFKKILVAGSFCFLTITFSIAFSMLYSKMVKHDKELREKLQIYEAQDLRLANMRQTLIVIYGLSDYEARYYSYIFDDFSVRFHIPWEVYPALIRIESNFNSGVISKSRAKGMTQVLESTGRTQAAKMGINFNDGTLWNCVLNMAIGFDYFSEGYTEKTSTLSDELALKHAIKRYCGGPGYARSNDSARIYVKEYKSTVWDEYVKVSYIFKGIQYDQLIAQQASKKKAETSRPLEIVLGFLTKLKALT